VEGYSFITSANFIIFDSNPNDVYSIAGMSMISSECEIFKYEIVDNIAQNPTAHI
jgi:hypothetical protein